MSQQSLINESPASCITLNKWTVSQNLIYLHLILQCPAKRRNMQKRKRLGDVDQMKQIGKSSNLQQQILLGLLFKSKFAMEGFFKQKSKKWNVLKSLKKLN